MFGIINQNFNFKTVIFFLLALISMVFSGMTCAGQGEHGECTFTVGPVHACVISFYKLLATPEKYDGKYISVVGYMDISNGRLAVYPTEMSYKLYIEQDSFTVKGSIKNMEHWAGHLGSDYVRLVGIFHYNVTGNYFRPGIGKLANIIGVNKVGPRPDVPEDHYLKFDVKSLMKKDKE